MIVLRRVNGKSMEPTLKEGRVVIGLLWFNKIKPGDVVIFEHSGIEKIKKVQKIKDGKMFVVGDNPGSSTDSRSFGWIKLANVKARLILK